jgi:hypothetical protein
MTIGFSEKEMCWPWSVSTCHMKMATDLHVVDEKMMM